MARYDVYRDPRGSENLLLCVQADMFGALETFMAIPLLPEHPTRAPLKKLNPIFVVNAKRYALYTQLMLAVPTGRLREPIANLKDHRDEITGALDFLFQGF
jgi:toxin CcdB